MSALMPKAGMRDAAQIVINVRDQLLPRGFVASLKRRISCVVGFALSTNL